MNIYKIRWLQNVVMLLFPVVIFFGVLLPYNDVSFWILIAALLLFCGLWKNIVYLLLSNILTWVIAIPIWWNLVGKGTPGSGETLAWAPVTFVYYLIIILLPTIIVVLIRNSVIKHFVNKQQAEI